MIHENFTDYVQQYPETDGFGREFLKCYLNKIIRNESTKNPTEFYYDCKKNQEQRKQSKAPDKSTIARERERAAGEHK